MIQIGSRGSPLALWQAEHVKSRLVALGHDAVIRVITTTGDRLLHARLETVGGKGAFLKEIEEALEAGEVDLAVHSLKDVPVAAPDGLVLCAILERADPRDAVLSAGARLDELPPGTRVGTTSLRRQCQIRAIRPDLSLADLRGNVDSRIRKLHEGQYGAILLAVAGLIRLGRQDEVTQVLEPDAFLPAPGQGAIALQCRADDLRIRTAVAVLNHPATAAAVTAERAFLAALGGGCNVPLGAYARPDAEGLRLSAFVGRVDGSALVRGDLAGTEPEALGRALAADLIARGARELMPH
jgi:hydroxymethylbilane synthase